MYRLALYQYKESFRKISFTRFLREEKKISLSEAKSALDKFLEGIPLLFIFNSKSDLLRFKSKAETLGAKCKTVNSPLFVFTSQFKSKGSNSAGNSAKKSAKSKPELAQVLMMN